MAFLIHIKKGTGLRNADGMFGTSDPYCQIQVEGGSSWKTSIIEDNLNPLWDQVYLVIASETPNTSHQLLTTKTLSKKTRYTYRDL